MLFAASRSNASKQFSSGCALVPSPRVDDSADETEASSFPPADCRPDAAVHRANDFSSTENSCCIRTRSDGGIRRNDSPLSTPLAPPPSRGLSCRWCRSIFPSVHTFGFAPSSPPLRLAPLPVGAVFTYEMRTRASRSASLRLRTLSAAVCEGQEVLGSDPPPPSWGSCAFGNPSEDLKDFWRWWTALFWLLLDTLPGEQPTIHLPRTFTNMKQPIS